MRIDGNVIAEDLYHCIRDRSRGREIRLGIVVGSDDPVIESFVRIKSRAAEGIGVHLLRQRLPEGADTALAVETVVALASHVDGLIVQLPLPASIDTDAVLSAIPPEKDVDGINPTVAEDARPVRAPVARAVAEIVGRAHADMDGKRAVVVGQGRLVGKPVAAMLHEWGAVVSIFSLESGSINDLKEADIVVSGAGTPGLIRPEHLKDGVILIDAGASEQSGTIRGDADPACERVASVFTPVPGGVGPIAVAMIFSNLFDLADR